MDTEKKPWYILNKRLLPVKAHYFFFYGGTYLYCIFITLNFRIYDLYTKTIWTRNCKYCGFNWFSLHEFESNATKSNTMNDVMSTLVNELIAQ
ncbi:hypothetical protein X975_21243, partial [Stegodyphus mimosarum]